jgi:hypothetical protein
MKSTKIITLFLGFFILSCSPQSPKTDIINETFPETQSEIKDLVADIFKDGAAKNLEALDAYHLNSPKFTRVEDNGLLSYEEGKVLEENFYGTSDILNYNIHNHKVDVYGDIAISSFHIDMNAIADSDTLDLKAKVSLTFAKNNGEWKIVHEHISPRLQSGT